MKNKKCEDYLRSRSLLFHCGKPAKYLYKDLFNIEKYLCRIHAKGYAKKETCYTTKRRY